ncbi:hypothetical protein LAZ67_1001269 [Cordylochernes scorpioides]|uniref:Uncharacterized protein n=1 Tax=Cordylochernes scorpioides TaxID=51811 RepID=A0ABY6JXW9_9ARAC|nr:hypothetical protein LAZ67_1001269 [Cordylochernes scorpioides]
MPVIERRTEKNLNNPTKRSGYNDLKKDINAASQFHQSSRSRFSWPRYATLENLLSQLALVHQHGHRPDRCRVSRPSLFIWEILLCETDPLGAVKEVPEKHDFRFLALVMEQKVCWLLPEIIHEMVHINNVQKDAVAHSDLLRARHHAAGQTNTEDSRPARRMRGPQARRLPNCIQKNVYTLLTFFSWMFFFPLTSMETEDIVPSTSAVPFVVPHTTSTARTNAQRQREYRLRKALTRTPEQVRAFAKAAAERQRRFKLRKSANIALTSGTSESPASTSCSVVERTSVPVVAERTSVPLTNAQRQRAFRQRRAASSRTDVQPTTSSSQTAIQLEQSTWYWSCRYIRPLIREAFTIIGRPPDLQGWVFGHGLDDDALAILASAKTRIYRHFLGAELRSVQEDPLLVWRRTLSRIDKKRLKTPPILGPSGVLWQLLEKEFRYQEILRLKTGNCGFHEIKAHRLDEVTYRLTRAISPKLWSPGGISEFVNAGIVALSSTRMVAFATFVSCIASGWRPTPNSHACRFRGTSQEATTSRSWGRTARQLQYLWVSDPSLDPQAAQVSRLEAGWGRAWRAICIAPRETVATQFGSGDGAGHIYGEGSLRSQLSNRIRLQPGRVQCPARALAIEAGNVGCRSPQDYGLRLVLYIISRASAFLQETLSDGSQVLHVQEGGPR